MEPTQHSSSLPSLENVVAILEAARSMAESRYQSCKYPYVSKAYENIFANFLAWLRDGVPPHQILMEAIQDERNILDIHNRSQAKILPEQQDTHGLSENVANFPIRYLSVEWLQILLPKGSLKPIYQVVKDHPQIKVEAQPVNANEDSARISRSDSIASSNGSAGPIGTGKARDAPSPGHDFPDANFTLAEIAAFLPHSIKSWDVADRILWNGAGQEDFQRMMNKYRTMPLGKIDNNSVYLMIRAQMRKRTQVEHNYAHWNVWVVGDQKDVRKPHDYDPDSISVTGFRRPLTYQARENATAEPIPFKTLASGISVWPEGDDALDLTRCIAWCADHPEEEYYYPSDYREVLGRVGGPMRPSHANSDGAVLARLRAGTGRTERRSHTMHNRNLNDAGTRVEVRVTQPPKRKHSDPTQPSTNIRSKRAKTTGAGPSPENHTRAKLTLFARKKIPALASRLALYDSEEDSEDETYQGPKRAKKIREAPRRSSRVKQMPNYGETKVQSDKEDELEEVAEEEIEEDVENVEEDEDESDDEMVVDD